MRALVMRHSALIAAAALLIAMFYVVLAGSVGFPRFLQALSIGVPAEASSSDAPSGHRDRGSRDRAVIESVIATEAAAVSRGNLDDVLALWAEDSVVRDENGTPDEERDDQRWLGRAGVRQRYIRELASRRYRVLRHSALDVRLEGDHAIVTNDLDAVVDQEQTTQQIRLVRSDRWTFVRRRGQWLIQELDVNRAGEALRAKTGQ